MSGFNNYDWQYSLYTSNNWSNLPSEGSSSSSNNGKRKVGEDEDVVYDGNIYSKRQNVGSSINNLFSDFLNSSNSTNIAGSKARRGTKRKQGFGNEEEPAFPTNGPSFSNFFDSSNSMNMVDRSAGQGFGDEEESAFLTDGPSKRQKRDDSLMEEDELVLDDFKVVAQDNRNFILEDRAQKAAIEKEIRKRAFINKIRKGGILSECPRFPPDSDFVEARKRLNSFVNDKSNPSLFNASVSFPSYFCQAAGLKNASVILRSNKLLFCNGQTNNNQEKFFLIDRKNNALVYIQYPGLPVCSIELVDTKLLIQAKYEEEGLIHRMIFAYSMSKEGKELVPQSHRFAFKKEFSDCVYQKDGFHYFISERRIECSNLLEAKSEARLLFEFPKEEEIAKRQICKAEKEGLYVLNTHEKGSALASTLVLVTPGEPVPKIIHVFDKNTVYGGCAVSEGLIFIVSTEITPTGIDSSIIVKDTATGDYLYALRPKPQIFSQRNLLEEFDSNLVSSLPEQVWLNLFDRNDLVHRVFSNWGTTSLNVKIANQPYPKIEDGVFYYVSENRDSNNQYALYAWDFNG